MNPGPVEEIGQATNAFMKIMHNEPLSLALVVMNVLLLGLFFYVIQTATAVRHAEMERIFAAQQETQKLLFQCVPVDRRGELPVDRSVMRIDPPKPKSVDDPPKLELQP